MKAPLPCNLKSALLILAVPCLMLLTTTSRSAGLLVADGGFGGVLEIEEQDVDVVINNGIAVTEVT